MDASRYFDAMHNAMSTLHAGAQLLLTVRLQDTCGNDAYLEVKQLPGGAERPCVLLHHGAALPEFPAVPQGLAAVPQCGWAADRAFSVQRRQPAEPDRLPRLLPGGSAGCCPHPAPYRGAGAACRYKLYRCHPAECPHRRTDHSGKSPWLRRTLELLESGRFPPACRWAQFCTGWLIFWPGTSAAPSSLTRRLPHWLRSGWQRTLLCSSAPPLP